MSVFCCPVCGEKLYFNEKEAYCGNGHRYDRAKQGYVNLLRNQASSNKRHGDDQKMISARSLFLSKGHYAPLLDEISSTISRYAKNGCVILDVGCGEGYYTEGINNRLLSNGIYAEIAAIDISKEAAKAASKRSGITNPVAVASAYSLPLASGSCDIVLSVFAPVAQAEFARVLKPGGVLVRAVPMPRHLFGLKEQLYKNPYENPPVSQALMGFMPLEFNELQWELQLDNAQDIEALFEMTPYYYKTSKEDQARFAAIEKLGTDVSFAVLVDCVDK